MNTVEIERKVERPFCLSVRQSADEKSRLKRAAGKLKTKPALVARAFINKGLAEMLDS
jgi:hypothetical protein